MDRIALTHYVKQLDMNEQDRVFLGILENMMYPDVSIIQYLDVKCDYRESLVSRGIPRSILT